jgi:hypothetical protein
MDHRGYEDFDEHMNRGGIASLRSASEFFMKDDPVFRTLRSITSKLEGLGIPYAVAGGMALVAHGYDRTTADVDILVTPDGLMKVHEALDGLGYLPPFTGSKHLRDGTTKVRIEFLTSGGFPGDGKPKPVAFPDPADVGVDIDGIRFLKLENLLELKLASGMTGGVNRLKDLADVVELIKSLNLPAATGERLNPYVREKFAELWTGTQEAISDHDRE